MEETRELGSVRIGELSRRTGVSPELLRAWEQRYGLLQPSRSAGGFRLYSEEDERRVQAMTALIRQGLSAGEAAVRAIANESAQVAAPERPLVGDLAATLERSLDAFDGEGAHTVFDRLLATVSVETLLLDVLLPYLRRLGERWYRGDVSVAQEHFASNLLRGRLMGLARDWGDGPGPTLVLACPPGEEHDLALIMFGIVASRRGRRIVFLGADTPMDTITDLVATTHPAAVVLAVTRSDPLHEHARTLRALADMTTVLIGGDAMPEDVAAVHATALDGDPVEAAGTLVV